LYRIGLCYVMKSTNVNVGEETKSKSDRFSMTQQHPKTDRKKHEI
jgi:hypothetical protein